MEIPAPGNGTTDLAVEALRLALMAVNHRHPGGEVQSADVLRRRVRALIRAGSIGDQETTGHELPVLIRDLHTSIVAGRDVTELLGLATLLHTQATIGWLRIAGASVDLREQAAVLACRMAEDRDTPIVWGLAAAGAMRVMLSHGALELAQIELDSVTVPTTTPEAMQLEGMLALYRAEVAAADNRPRDVAPALEYAEELAGRTGEGNAYWLGFGPTNTGFCAGSWGRHQERWSPAVSRRKATHRI